MNSARFISAIERLSVTSFVACAWPSVCCTPWLRAGGHDFDCFEPASVELKGLIKVKSNVALRFAGAYARNAPIVNSVAASYRELHPSRRATVRSEHVVEDQDTDDWPHLAENLAVSLGVRAGRVQIKEGFSR